MGQTGGSRASIKISQVPVSNPKRKMNAFGPVQRNDYVEQELSCLSAPNGKETAHRDGGLHMR